MNKFIARLFPVDELIFTIRRFPTSVACAFLIFALIIFSVHDVIDLKDALFGRIVITAVCLYFWFGIAKLVSESMRLSAVKHGLIALSVAVLFITLIFFAKLWMLHLLFLIPALQLLLMVAPYFKGGDNLSVWFFNRKLWFGVAVSYIALLMFSLGVCAALFAIHKLFGVDVPSEIYQDLWAFSCCVLGPVYALSWVPKRFEFTDEDCSDPPGLKFIVNWISVPMVMTYLLILYAYFIKITISQDLPDGILAYLICGFAGAGVVAYLMSWPLREEGTMQLRLFHKIFFPALIIPTGFYFYAIWERVSAYGITEQRYFLILSAIWFLIISLGNTFAKMPIKAIPAVLAVLLILGSYGPFGGVSVSTQSQFARLEALLVKNDLLKDGVVQKSENDISFEDRKSISSILDYFCNSPRREIIKPWFDITENEHGKDRCNAYKLTEQIGFKYVSRYMKADHEENGDFRVSVNYQNKSLFSVDGYTHFINGKRAHVSSKKPLLIGTLEDDSELFLTLNEDGDLTIKKGEDILVSHNVISLIKEYKDKSTLDELLVVDAENDKVAVRFFIDSFSGSDKDDVIKMKYINTSLAFRLKE